MSNPWTSCAPLLGAALPSLQDAFCKDLQSEALLRAKSARFIFLAGMDLDLPTSTIITACTFMHRFYLWQSFRHFNHYEIAATSLYLACKCQESLRRTVDLIKVVIRTAMKRPGMSVDTEGKDFLRWSNVLVRLEEDMVRTLCFDFHLDFPYPYLETLLDHLEQEPHQHLNSSDRQPMLRLAWLWLNDSYRTTVCVTHSPMEVAASAILLSAKCYLHQTLKVLAAFDHTIQEQWCQAMGVSLGVIEKAMQVMEGVYRMQDIRTTLEARFELHEWQRRLEWVEDESLEDRRAVVLACLASSKKENEQSKEKKRSRGALSAPAMEEGEVSGQD